MNNKLPGFIQSHEQLSLYVMQIDRYSSFLLQKKAGSEAQEPQISAELKKYLQSAAGGDAITESVLERVRELFKQMHSEAPRFNITFASAAGGDIKKDIVEWFRENIHAQALVAFHYDRSIAGGMVIRGRNNIFNFSFAQKLKNPKSPLTSIINKTENETEK